VVIELSLVVTVSMPLFLSTVSQRPAQEFSIMVMDQTGWHIASALQVPTNMRLVLLFPYSPEINPAEHNWKALHEDCVGNTVFANLDAANKALSTGLRSLESSSAQVQYHWRQMDNFHTFERNLG